MSPDWIARTIAAVSAFVALSGIAWSVLSWRLTGPSLRIHCLAYRDVLVLRLFNAGRTPDSVEQIVLGRKRGGIGGIDLTSPLDLPLRLEAGETKRWRLNPRASPLAENWPMVTAGWASLWLLMGSMRQHRVEVMPYPENLPPEVGWQLVPRRTKAARYMPLLAGSVAVWAISAGTSASEVALVTSLGVFVFLRGFWVMPSSRPFRRRRVERWAVATGSALSVVELARTSNMTSGESPAFLDTTLLGTYLLVALILATPGAVVEVKATWQSLLNYLRLAYAWMRVRLTPTPEDETVE